MLKKLPVRLFPLCGRGLANNSELLQSELKACPGYSQTSIIQRMTMSDQVQETQEIKVYHERHHAEHIHFKHG